VTFLQESNSVSYELIDCYCSYCNIDSQYLCMVVKHKIYRTRSQFSKKVDFMRSSEIPCLVQSWMLKILLESDSLCLVPTSFVS
jgi:hypothetical protein